ncbi:MAG: NAD(P)-dependent alcohol dehydrogenase [Bryobacteraceae bacterium]|nr:NAD(P)-dependent alcohol dehydrogenase [Bryobacteraceae bacterium]
MTTATIQHGRDIDSLQIGTKPVPEPHTGEVRVRIHAASLNFRDLLIARGLYPSTRSGPIVPVSDGAGVVDRVGGGVTQFQPGDRVVVSYMRDWISGPVNDTYGATAHGGELDGMLTEYIVLPEHSLVPIPASLSFEEAAALPCAGITAWNSLIEAGQLKAGETVLIQGSGGVSVFALQIAILKGARVIATSSSDAKLARFKELGAEFGINYKTTPDWSAAVLDYTNGSGVDHVVDVGGPDTFSQSLRALRTGGTLAVVGVLSGVETSLNLLPLLMKQLRLNGIYVGSRQMLSDLIAALDGGGVKPVIDSTFPLSEIARAYRHLASGQHFGKVVIQIGS